MNIDLGFAMKNRLTKTAYLRYLSCPNEFWLDQNIPSILSKDVNTLEYEHLRQQGYDVERYVKMLQRFHPDDTKLVEFQRAFQTDDLYARSDVTVTDKATGVIDIYEVKSSASVKDEHYDDLAFQKITAERSGFTIGRSNVITMNGEYVRRGDLDVEQLFNVTDVSDVIDGLIPKTEQQIADAIAYADSEPVPMLSAYCKDNKLDCAFIRLHFPDLPDYTIFDVSRLNKSKISDLLELDVIDIVDIPDDFPLSAKQRIQVAAAKTREVAIDRDKIRELIDGWEYPLHFLDYETFSYAIPLFDGVRPFQQMCFQYSLHTIREKGGEIGHRYFLSTGEAEPPRSMVEQLLQDMAGDVGTVFVWYEPFEKSRNDEMAAMYPEFADFFAEVNSRVFDLMKIFSDHLYVHPDFRGSSSIKKVMPVIVPELSYNDLGIRDGMTASISWFRATTWTSLGEDERRRIYSDLQKYCYLDTWAMVEIFNRLENL